MSAAWLDYYGRISSRYGFADREVRGKATEIIPVSAIGDAVLDGCLADKYARCRGASSDPARVASGQTDEAIRRLTEKALADLAALLPHVRERIIGRPRKTALVEAIEHAEALLGGDRKAIIRSGRLSTMRALIRIFSRYA